MENAHLPSRTETDYEIMSRIDSDIYFEIEIVCDGIKQILSNLRRRDLDVLTNTYLHQCSFLVEQVLEYIRNRQKTTVHFITRVEEGTGSVYRIVHLREIEVSQEKMKDVFERFKDAAYFIFPGAVYPEYLFGLNAKMKYVNIFMADLFELEKTKLIPQRVTGTFNALRFEPLNMN